MWALRLVGVVVGGSVLAAARDQQEGTGRQLNHYQNYHSGGRGGAAAGGYGSSSNNDYLQSQPASNSLNNYQATSDLSSLLQQLQDSNTGYYDNYGSQDYTQESYLPVAAYSTGAVGADANNASPALSALALLGFLYFLNLIQDVLQNNGRRRRSLEGEKLLRVRRGEEGEEEGHYHTSYLDEDELQVVAQGKEARARSSDGASPRAFSFLEDFFIRLPQALGLQWKQAIDRDGRDEKPMGLGNFFTSRVKMISSIMSFLQNPDPTRIKRSMEDLGPEESESGREAGEQEGPSLQSFLTLTTEVLQDYINSQSGSLKEEATQEYDVIHDNTTEEESKEEQGVMSRGKRHSRYTMNAWYQELGGHSAHPSSGAGGVAAKVVSLMGGGHELQDVVQKAAVPTLRELSQGLDGRHPHCMQRALCRLTYHSKHLPLMSRLTLQILSNNLAGTSISSGSPEDNTKALEAGKRGEDCEQTFPDCGTT